MFAKEILKQSKIVTIIPKQNSTFHTIQAVQNLLRIY